jgi:hypothetical protein
VPTSCTECRLELDSTPDMGAEPGAGADSHIRCCVTIALQDAAGLQGTQPEYAIYIASSCGSLAVPSDLTMPLLSKRWPTTDRYKTVTVITTVVMALPFRSFSMTR